MKGSKIRLMEKTEGWYVQEYHPTLKEWHDKTGPCKTKKTCEQRKAIYLKSVDAEFCRRVGDQVMSKHWSEVVL